MISGIRKRRVRKCQSVRLTASGEYLHAAAWNVANIGNIVAQLHVHVIARYDSDAAWPGPVWRRSKRFPR